MSIELHCPQCGKLIRAPDQVAGKQGKCPYCSTSVYVPMPPDESEAIGLAPVDNEAQRRADELRRETARYAASIGHATDIPRDQAGTTGESGGPDAGGQVVDLGQEVETFLLAMHDSKLDEAHAAVVRLKGAGQRARDYVEGLILDEMPLELEGVPGPLVKGFLRTLLDRLG